MLSVTKYIKQIPHKDTTPQHPIEVSRAGLAAVSRSDGTLYHAGQESL